MSKLGWILISLSLALVGLPMGVAAQATGLPPTVHLDTYTGKPTHTFSFNGEGFAPNEQVDVYLGSQSAGPLVTLVADDRGNVISPNITIPMMAAGDYKLAVSGRTSQTSASVGFNVQGFHPWVVLDNYYIAPHASVGVQGDDFIPGETVQIFLNSLLGEPLAQITADADGRFAVQTAFQLPDVTDNNQLIFIGQQSQTQVTATFSAATPPPSSPD
jgi:hypothetical protein